MAPRIYESQSCGSMGSDWSGPRGNLAHYSRPSKHSRRFEARSFWTSYVAEGVADVVQDESGLGGDPPFRNPAQTIAEQVTGRARLPRDPMLWPSASYSPAKQRCYAAKRAEPLPTAWSWLRLRQPIVC